MLKRVNDHQHSSDGLTTTLSIGGVIDDFDGLIAEQQDSLHSPTVKVRFIYSKNYKLICQRLRSSLLNHQAQLVSFKQNVDANNEDVRMLSSKVTELLTEYKRLENEHVSKIWQWKYKSQ